jgi:serine/threonine protein kinase
MLSPHHVLQNRYRIIRPLGKGGMGHVYEAMDEAVDCVVAIKETFAATDKLRHAFEREAKLLANLRHPVLPRVTHHFVEGDGQFLVMDYVDGLNLSELLAQRKRPFTAEELIPDADKLLGALHYLHTRSEPIIHRDIKPANIKRSSEGEIYLLDFGLAKGSAGQMSTMEPGESFFSSVYGYTAAYAPLEQLTNAGTNAQSDLYGLGATLYHLLTGQAPLSANVRYEAIEMGAVDPLPAIHQLNPRIPPAVSEVIAGAMAMSRRDRTRAASEMREALAEAMRTAPALAPVGAQEQQATMIMPPAAAPVSQSEAPGAEVSWPSQISPSGAPSSAPVEPPPIGATEAARTDYAERPVRGNESKAIKTIVADAPQPAQPVWNDAVSGSSVQAVAPRKSPVAKILIVSAVLLILLIGAVVVLMYSLGGGEANTNSVTNTSSPASQSAPTVHDYSFVRDLQSGQGVVWSVVFSPDGKYAVSGGEDKRLRILSNWSKPEWHITATGEMSSMNSVASWPRDPNVMAAAGNDGKILIYNIRDGETVTSWSAPDEVYFLAFSPTQEVLASVGKDKSISLWDGSGRSIRQLSSHTDVIWAVAFSPDGRLLASASKDKTVRIWTPINDWREYSSQPLYGHSSAVISVVFSPDGKLLATGSDDNTIRLWDTQTWETVRTLTGHTSYVTSLAFSPDGGTLASASNDQSIRLWNVRTGELRQVLNGHNKGVTSVCFSPDGQSILSGGRDGAVKLWQ